MALLIDTNALAWFGVGDPRLSSDARQAMTDGAQELLVSAVTAYEFADLNNRNRFDADLPLDALLRSLEAEIIDYPADCWPIAATLPDLHRDPVDRLVIAHAIQSGFTLITSDATMRRYPVRSLW